MATIVGTPAPDFLVGTADADLILGYESNDTLIGGLGNDTLDGGTGADSMDGGDYNDTYYVDNIGDVAAEQWNDALGGIDTVISTVSHALGKGMENLTLTGSAAINGTGNANNNVINGNSGNNYLFGADGNDSLYGGNGNDTLDGGSGADTMDGGDNNDIYYVDNVGDAVAEQWNDALGGVDSVFSSVSHSLGKGIENLTLTGSGANYGYGNGNNNVIRGNSGNNYLFGADGNDSLYGGGGNDTLDGGSGADTMDGGDYNDIYYVDNTGDVVSEYWNDALGGVDSVFSSVSHTLGKGIENLTLTGAGYYGSGNSNNNVITGNSANNYLAGLDGSDTLYGGAGADVLVGGLGTDWMDGGSGNDVYYADAYDHIDEQVEGIAGGIDTIYTSEQMEIGLGVGIENLILTGSASINGVGHGQDNYMAGNSGNNGLGGYGGNDTLYGGLGADTLAGGDGSDLLISSVDGCADVFSFFGYLDGTVDVIQGAEFPTDQFELNGMVFDALHTASGKYGGELGAQYFHAGSGFNGSGWFDGAGLWYDTSAGCLYYNPTQNVFGINSGDEVMFARFSGTIPSLSSSDFTLV